jgi:cytochrome c peroxidase
MLRRISAIVAVAVISALPIMTIVRGVSAQTETKVQAHTGGFPIYNPYPPGILPADINPELERVLGEINVIEQRAMDRFSKLGPVTYIGQPPTIQGNGTEAIETLGELLNFDKNMSPGRNSACSSCHMPYVAFGPPIPSVNLTMIAYPGTAHFRAGKRNPQRYSYAPFFPVLKFNETQQAFFGGNFWDSRATGYLLRNPDAQQAQGPPVDTQEMGNPDIACIAFKISQAPYRSLFEQLFGASLLQINFPGNTDKICATPGGAQEFGTDTTPVHLSPQNRVKAQTVYDHWAQAIDAYEQSQHVSPFSSKFDAWLKDPQTTPLSADELAGYELFRGKAGCNTCHLDGRGSTQTPGTGGGTTPSTTTGSDTSASAQSNPLFTCFGSANLGLPLNPRDAFFYQTTPDPFGFTPNPLGFGYRDLGLGTFLRSGFGSGINPNSNWIQFAPTSDGQMQTSSARNVAMTPAKCPTTEAPGPYFQKEFFHNGYIKSLKQLVHFYNTRDVFAKNVTSGHCPQGTTEKVDCWPMPEVTNNLDMSVGNLGLTDQEENQIVAFLQTLTDGFTKPYPNADVFAGKCMEGGSAATQGNDQLIQTPTLPPCAKEVCGVPPLPTKPIP